jgi:hypothetical protein
VLSSALILALAQSDETGIRLLPAWNREINAAFRLPLYGGGWVEAVLENGELTVTRLEGRTESEIQKGAAQ